MDSLSRPLEVVEDMISTGFDRERPAGGSGDPLGLSTRTSSLFGFRSLVRPIDGLAPELDQTEMGSRALPVPFRGVRGFLTRTLILGLVGGGSGDRSGI
jgi:hypothetical protein